MRMKIYDYINRPVEVDLPDKEIKAIVVKILSGDETGFVLFEDGSRLEFDASMERISDYEYGCYFVLQEYMAEWMNWKPIKDSASTVYSYDRCDWCWGKLLDDKLEDYLSSEGWVHESIFQVLDSWKKDMTSFENCKLPSWKEDKP